ncbi:MAG: LptF/LptG family permease [Rhodospirillales bacterium]|nr:LptF/LptG family permease [Rhodospirillales bacterium]
MNRITRYIMLQLAIGMIFVTSILTCVIWLAWSLRFVELIVNQGVSAGTFAYLTALMLPNFLPFVLPLAMAIVVTFFYNKMTTDRELVVMRASGMSQIEIAKPALFISSIVMILIFAVNFYFLPKSYQKFREFQWEIRYNYSNVLLQEGMFNSISKDITVYVRERNRNGELVGILVHDNRVNGRPATLMAERGALVDTDKGARVVMFSGNRQVVDKKASSMSILYFDRYTFDMESAGEAAPSRYREARERMVPELLNARTDQTILDKDRGKFLVEGHNRITGPLLSLTFTIAALACMISGPFTRRGQVKRVTAVAGLVILLQGLVLGVNSFVAKNLGMAPLIYLMAILPMIICWFVVIKPHVFKRLLPQKNVLVNEGG